MLSHLRAFAGVVNMTVQMIGFTAQGDGGQGTFCWSNNPGTDDGGVTCIVPYGVTSGCWLRQIPGYVATSATLAGFITSVPTIAALRAVSTTTLPNGLVFVEGYASGADGGEGMFWYNSADAASADNGGTIITDTSNRRWYRETSGTVKNVQWFGANPTIADCTSAMNLALASLSGTGGALYFPRGLYTFLGSPSFNYPTGQFAVTVFGDGQDATILQWPSASGLSFTANSPLHTIHLRDFTMSYGGAGGSTVGITLTNNVQGGDFGQNDIVRITFRGSDGGAASNYWNTALSIVGWGNFEHDSNVFYGVSAGNAGIGVSLLGAAGGVFKYNLIHNFSKCSWFNLGEGLVYGSYVQGVTLSQCNFTNGTTDIIIPSGAVGCVQLSATGSQFAGLGERILLNGALATLQLQGNLIFVEANQIGLAINSTWGQFTITGNCFSGMSTTGSFGIVVAATGYTSLAVGNAFYGLGTGITLQGATTGGWIVALNNYSGSTNAVTNIGPNQVGVITQ